MGKRGGHGKRARKSNGEGNAWEPVGSHWNRDYLKAFMKERSKIVVGDKTGEDEQRKIILAVGGKAEKLRIRPGPAGKLAAQLCEDFDRIRVQTMQDLINNPGILESIKRVMAKKGDEDDVEEAKDCEEVEGDAGDGSSDA